MSRTPKRRQRAYEIVPSVEHIVTDEFLAGGRLADLNDYKAQSADIRVDVEDVRRLVDEAIQNFGPRSLEGDAWLAPRLHNLLRLERRQASNQGFWRWMALEVMPDYVRHRWAQKKKGFDNYVDAYSYLGTGYFLRRNAVSRLWWGAEIMRNGADYTEVEPALKNSGIDQYALDLRFGNLRPAAIAFSRVARGAEVGRPLKFDEIKALSKRVNLLLSGTSLESLAPAGQDEVDDPYEQWVEDDVDPETLVTSDLGAIEGPPDSKCADDEIDEYIRWFAEVARDVTFATQPATKDAVGASEAAGSRSRKGKE